MGVALKISVAALGLGMTFFGMADVTVNGMFTDRMVLQRDHEVLVYGAADENEKVTVTFNGQKVSAKTQDGRWQVALTPMRAGGPFLMTVRGKNTVTFDDVLVGDVWVLGGQSNMARRMSAFQWLMQRLPTLEENDRIRLFKVAEGTQADEPGQQLVVAKEFGDSWQYCTRELLPYFSPLGYFFATEHIKRTKVPIGLVYACRGATRAESWMPMWALEARPEYADILDQEKNPNYRPDKKTGEPNMNRPAGLFNGTVSPVIPYTIKGFLWNQGESNSADFETYRTLFPDLIRAWRKEWGQGDLPFVFAQVSSYQDRPARLALYEQNGQETAWAWQRDAQACGVQEPNTAMVAAHDIGEWLDIHPQDKETLAKRYELAVAALDGEPVVAKGPVYKHHLIQGGVVTITFDSLGGGLETRRVAMNKAKGMAPGTDPEALIASADTLQGFVICGEDRVFYPAEAQIQGDTVLVSSPQVCAPVAVRYAWTTFALANLYNQAGLPAYPFRTDAFPPPVVQ